MNKKTLNYNDTSLWPTRHLQAADITDREIMSLQSWVCAEGDGCIITEKFSYPTRNYCDAAFEIWLGIRDTHPAFYLSDGNGMFIDLIAENISVTDGQWHHIAAVRDNSIGSVIIYVDGNAAAKAEFDGKAVNPVVLRSRLVVGHEFNNKAVCKNEFSGKLAHICLWDRAVSASEAAVLAENMCIPVMEDSVIACWPLEKSFEDCSGNGMELVPYKYKITAQDEEFAEFSAPVRDGEYTVAFIPDTQTVMYRGEVKEQDFKCIYDWLIANKEKYNIRFVMSLGDITENSGREPCDEHNEERIAKGRREWMLARQQFLRLSKAGIPWSAIQGNHDYGTGYTGRRDSSFFNESFPFEEVSAYPYFGGALNSPESVSNAYYYLEAGGNKYLLLCLENEPRDAAIEWANRVIEDHPDHKVIITTHEYIGKDASYTKKMWLLDENGDFVYSKEGWKMSFRGTYQADLHYECGACGGELWEQLVSCHKNIQMIVCGHLDTANIVTRADKGINGNEVLQAVVDTQGIDWTFSPASAVALAVFSADGSTVTWRLVSTAHGREVMYTDENGEQSTCFEGWYLDEDSNRINFKL